VNPGGRSRSIPSVTANRSSRKRFLQGAVAAAAAGSFAPRVAASSDPFDPRSWSSIRAQFALDPHTVNLTTFLLAPHPRPVRDAIRRHARLLDSDAKRYLDEQEATGAAEAAVRAGAARYLDVEPDELALTDSTTMGLALLYGGLLVPPESEVVTTTHDFYSTHESLRLRVLRTGASMRKIRLYADPRAVSLDEVVSGVRGGVSEKTRALAVTWVHSSTGVKLPIRAIADAIRSINDGRPTDRRILLCVDGVHGFGVEDATPNQLGCDFLVSGCHKWLYGPRGTGLIWGRPEAWQAVTPTIPTFDVRAFPPWLGGEAPPPKGIPGLPRAVAMTPGGFHSFEHRWALREAFDFRRKIGQARVARRTHDLAAQLKDGLRSMKRVRLITPSSASLSSGLVCFEVIDADPADVVRRLYERSRVVASVTPYAARYVRLGPSMLNTPQDVEHALRAVRAIA
jgi:selenocysteine lyase/cysteine desulfurase